MMDFLLAYVAFAVAMAVRYYYEVEEGINVPIGGAILFDGMIQIWVSPLFAPLKAFIILLTLVLKLVLGGVMSYVELMASR